MDVEDTPPWVADLLAEVRRAGRAAVAARAAAEACDERIERLEAVAAAPAREAEGDAADLLEALLPVFDAVDRIAADAGSTSASPGSFWARWSRAARAATELRALREAVRLLHTQLAGALESRGVVVERDLGADVDPERHRVVELRRAAGTAGGRVLEIVRPGYRLGSRRLREADVVASERPSPPRPRSVGPAR
ncbi:MAG TPA: nucleotide exchange factor GrpE [Sandaracinaceae bacterium LLY-WYZ-13_1]|nr:nucleotide exchange factor GrpE [Sandaracinaceae bacterium LLY-WYZ-13_1]